MIRDLKEENLNNAIKHYDEKNYEQAKVILSKLIEETNAREYKKIVTDAYYYLANIFHLAGEIGKAIKAFNKVLELEPGHTDASISLSVLYNDIGYYDNAKKIFDTASERVKSKSNGSSLVDDTHINKKFSSKHYELAELYMSYGRYDEALFEYNKVVSLDNENLEARVKIAKVYAKKNFLSKAYDELQKLKVEYPDFLDARVALGILFYGNGKVLEARTEWERVINKDPFNQDAATYLNISKTATETNIF